MKIDNDFKDLVHDGSSNKSKPALIALAIVIVIIIAISWSVFAYLNQSNKSSDTPAVETSEIEGNIDTTVSPQVDDAVTQEANTPSSNPSNSSLPSSSGKSGTSSDTSTSNLSKCEPLNDEATRLRQSADQKKITYDNAFASRKNYGYFYDQYGSSSDAQREYNAQEAQLTLLQTDWKDTLNKGNAAYSKYQECRASL
jgi:cytoskeletal protein RodZ